MQVQRDLGSKCLTRQAGCLAWFAAKRIPGLLQTAFFIFGNKLPLWKWIWGNHIDKILTTSFKFALVFEFSWWSSPSISPPINAIITLPLLSFVISTTIIIIITTREGLKNCLFFLGIYPKSMPAPSVHLGMKMSLLAKKIWFSRPKTMATGISHKV